MRPSVRLIAGRDSSSRIAAPPTLRSSSNASSAVSRFRSICTQVILSLLFMHLKLCFGASCIEAMRIVIADGGLVGLTAAASLQQLGHEVTVLEQAPAAD